jgi:hypothetical protein
MLNQDKLNSGTKNMDILYEKVQGSRTASNFFWTFVIFLGSLGFLIVGISSYVKYNIIGFLNSNSIIFFPQGLVMCIYGCLGILLSLYQGFTIWFQIGEGYLRYIKINPLI